MHAVYLLSSVFKCFTPFFSLLCQLHKVYIEINIYQAVKHLVPFFWKSVRSYTVADLAIFELEDSYKDYLYMPMKWTIFKGM